MCGHVRAQALGARDIVNQMVKQNEALVSQVQDIPVFRAEVDAAMEALRFKYNEIRTLMSEMEAIKERLSGESDAQLSASQRATSAIAAEIELIRKDHRALDSSTRQRFKDLQKHLLDEISTVRKEVSFSTSRIASKQDIRSPSPTDKRPPSPGSRASSFLQDAGRPPSASPLTRMSNTPPMSKGGAGRQIRMSSPTPGASTPGTLQYAPSGTNQVGVGIKFSSKATRGLVVSGVVAGSAAEEGGVQLHDRVVSIDNVDITAMKASEAVARIFGAPYQPVKIGIERVSTSKGMQTLTMSLTRMPTLGKTAKTSFAP